MKLIADTDPEFLREYFGRLRAMTPGERLERGFDLCDEARRIVADGVRMRHSNYNDTEVKLAVARLTWGEESFRQFFPDSQVLPRACGPSPSG